VRYPGGSTIRVGDLVWWDEGYCVGYVQVVAESKEEYEGWGLRCPHIFVSNRHPFDPTLGTGVAYDVACFEDEGIGLLTPEERNGLEQAAAKAQMNLKANPDDLTYAVTTEVQNCQQTAWIFTFMKDDEEVEVVKIPVHQNEKST
jgi:hypothetical protein